MLTTYPIPHVCLEKEVDTVRIVVLPGKGDSNVKVSGAKKDYGVEYVMNVLSRARHVEETVQFSIRRNMSSTSLAVNVEESVLVKSVLSNTSVSRTLKTGAPSAIRFTGMGSLHAFTTFARAEKPWPIQTLSTNVSLKSRN